MPLTPRLFTITLAVALLGAGAPSGLPAPGEITTADAAQPVRSLSAFDANEQLRYALETMDLSYTDFLARKADFFTSSKCDNRWPEAPGDPPTSEGCEKPPPYNAFDWTDDSCSPPTPPVWRSLFHAPCQQHDFGYRNFGKGLALRRDEDTRAWIDSRFRAEMERLCNNTFPRPWQIANKQACFNEADIIWGAVRHSSFVGNDWSTPLVQGAA